MIIPTRLKKIAAIAESNSIARHGMLNNVHIRKRNNNTELTASDGKKLLRFVVPCNEADHDHIDDCELQVHSQQFKQAIGAAGTISHHVDEQPNGVISFKQVLKGGMGSTVDVPTASDHHYPDAAAVLEKPVHHQNGETVQEYEKHYVSAKLLRDLLDAIIAAGGDYVDITTSTADCPVYIDGKTDDKKGHVRFHGILMPATK